MSVKTCKACSAEIPESAQFCPQCGEPTSVKTARTKKTAARPQPTMLRDTIIVLGALVLIVVGYFAFADRPQPPQPPQAQQPAGDPAHQGMNADALQMLNNLPNDYNALVNAGHTLMDQGNFALAAEAYKRALAIDPSSPDVRTDYGACLNGMGLPERAIAEFKTVIASTPTHAIAHFNAGIVYYNMQQFDSAKVYWSRLQELAPGTPAAERAKELMAQLDN